MNVVKNQPSYIHSITIIPIFSQLPITIKFRIYNGIYGIQLAFLKNCLASFESNAFPLLAFLTNSQLFEITIIMPNKGKWGSKITDDDSPETFLLHLPIKTFP